MSDSISSPVRRGFRMPDLRGRAQVPMVLSAAITFTAVTIITLYGHPVFGDQWVTSGENVSLGVISVLFQAVILASVVGILLRRFRPLPGAFILLLGINGIAMTWIGNSFVLFPGIVLTGLVADGLTYWLRPTVARSRVFRIILAVAPLVYCGSYFATVGLTSEVAWVVYIWAGAIVLAGLTGLLVSYLTLPDERTRTEWG